MSIIAEHDDATAGMHDARYRVSTARLTVFEAECFRLAAIAQRNPQRRQEIVACLCEIARDHGLLAVAGEDMIGRLFGDDAWPSIAGEPR
ncbi:hypothetical protein [Bradyrhizobium diazoefficiens]|uniref:hypothetical protein n=1 Tax=Bradyrhizobium diazoefficiens TaxID=1355477 RepID=UPI000BE7C84E|nr:hypothetical protein [Bradyrhizobium diazoefficiens]PDT56215.1 hypothetical protein CO678_39525 [Bradyrhizobium diazoefficiens]WLB40505.1 hypothetical protein QIH78_12210 [Bradyrhizobium diazoefficiens]WLC14517.1 hypothetical protein QIH76_30820 [Bradyrhizobium diazoefficiens]